MLLELGFLVWHLLVTVCHCSGALLGTEAQLVGLFWGCSACVARHMLVVGPVPEALGACGIAVVLASEALAGWGASVAWLGGPCGVSRRAAGMGGEVLGGSWGAL